MYFCPRCLTEDPLEIKISDTIEIFCNNCNIKDNNYQNNDCIKYLHYFDNDTILVVGIPIFALKNFESYNDFTLFNNDSDEFILEKGWKLTDTKVGYVGFKRKKREAEFDELYGKGDRKICHRWNRYILNKDMALSLYETAYYQFLSKNSDILEWLTKTASNVYDYSENNIKCGYSYNMDGEKAAHYQDIAVKRAVRDLGYSFNGYKNIQIRGKDSEGYALNPGLVSFHIPEFISKDELYNSEENPRIRWKQGSVESFWQNNKVLVVRE